MKKPIIISLSVQKGGTGKSSISANLSYALAELGNKILIIDTDAQMDTTTAYGLELNEKNFYKAFINGEDIKDHIIPTDYENIDFVVSDYNVATLEAQMTTMLSRELRMRNILETINSEAYYDFVIIDTSSDLGMLNTSILHAVDYALIPIEPARFSIGGMMLFMQHFEDIRENSLRSYHKDIKILGIVMNMYRKIENASKNMYELISETDFLKEHFLKTVLNQDTNVVNAQSASIPIGAYNKKTTATKDINKLAREVLEIVSNKEKE